MNKSSKRVAIIMGSKSDWPTMNHAAKTLDKLKIKYDCKVVSAHRTPDLLYKFASLAEEKGIEVIIAGAGGSAHLPGMTASKTHIPVIGVPIKTKNLEGMDSLLSIVQMPAGIPVGTVAIGKSGAINAALLAASILSNKYPEIKNQLKSFRTKQTKTVLKDGDPRK
ncbi:MAG: 5-(carboxyamino)imidazole ribonucleotide mutase [Gammaproteobacteria bacterium]|nr:5-(carboxyamino)imidazole ribonucleotide mutase [Gammaproteobacteria bacterium]